MEFELLKRVLVEVLNVDDNEIHMDTTFISDLGADSLDVFQIVVRLQEKLDTTFEPEMVEKITTVAEAVALLEKSKKE